MKLDVCVTITVTADELRKCRRYLDLETLVRGKVIAAHVDLLEILTPEVEANEASD